MRRAAGIALFAVITACGGGGGGGTQDVSKITDCGRLDKLLVETFQSASDPKANTDDVVKRTLEVGKRMDDLKCPSASSRSSN